MKQKNIYQKHRKMKYFSTYTYIGAIIFFLLSFSGYTYTNAASSPSLIVPDTIAGYGNDIEIQNLGVDESVTLSILSPNGKIFKETYRSTNASTMQVSIPEEETTVSGEYSVQLLRNEENIGERYTFEVYPDTTSAIDSLITSNTISVALNREETIVVTLSDSYGNPVEGHDVSLISSRSEDTITPKGNEKTSSNGQVRFSISSSKEGSSSFSAIDITDGVTLSKRKNILFYDSGETLADVGNESSSEIEKEDSGSELFSQAAKFSVDFPNEVFANSDENYITVTVLDSEDRIVKDYEESIIIRVPSDANAQLPGNDGVYTFSQADQGAFTFPRSIIFSSEGEHVIEVFKYNLQTQEVNVNIYGSKTTTVKEKSTTIPGPTSEVIEVLSPSNNSEFSSSELTIRGKGLPDTDITLFVDDIPKETISVGSTGVFALTVDSLSDGRHSVYAVQNEGNKEQSKIVFFTTDASLPEFKKATFSPEKTEKKGVISLSVEAEPKLKTVEAFWGTNSEFLKEKKEGIYELDFAAPDEVGTYPIKIVLIDSLSNRTTKTLETKLEIVDQNASGEVELTAEFNASTNKIDLSWNASNMVAEPILYIIQSGTNKNDLQKTKSIAANKSTTSLEVQSYGNEYFFSIVPIMGNGEEGVQSNIISITPVEPTPTPAPETPTPTPTIKPTPEPTPTPTPKPIEKKFEFTLSNKESSILASWDAKPGINKYLVSYGLSSQVYGEKKIVQGTSFLIQNLIPHTTYFVQVQSIDALGNISHSYGEKSSVVIDTNFHPAPTLEPKPYPQWMSETGPKLFIILGGIFLTLGSFILLTRRKY